MGTTVDPEGFAAIALEMLSSEAFEIDVGAETLRIGPDGAWVRWNRDRAYALRGPMRRLLLALAEKQSLGDPDPVRAVELADIGWPDEQPRYEWALNRVYVTLSRLRKVLPESAIERFDEGYRLAPRVIVRRSRHLLPDIEARVE